MLPYFKMYLIEEIFDTFEKMYPLNTISLATWASMEAYFEVYRVDDIRDGGYAVVEIIDLKSNKVLDTVFIIIKEPQFVKLMGLSTETQAHHLVQNAMTLIKKKTDNHINFSLNQIKASVTLNENFVDGTPSFIREQTNNKNLLWLFLGLSAVITITVTIISSLGE